MVESDLRLYLLPTAPLNKQGGGKGSPFSGSAASSVVRCHAKLIPNWGSVCRH